MLDSLIQYLLEEIAMDGETGTDVRRLHTFINDYFNPPHTATTPANSIPSTQNNDQAFLSFVWDTLIELDDIHVGVLHEIDPLTEPEPAEEIEETKGKKTKGKKGKGKKEIPAGPPPTHKFDLLKGDDKRVGRDALVELYGDGLRIAVSSEEVWAAITGSHARPSSVTPKVYELLQLVSRGKGEGATVVQIGKTLGIDQRSAFHYVRVAISIGAVKKFRVTESGAWTNRILHVRYLDVSPHWAIHIATDGPDDSDEGADHSADEEAPQSSRVTAISRSHLSINPDLVRGRILRALKAAPNQTLPHIDIASTIGLFSHTKADLRRLNSLIQHLCTENKIEKVTLFHPSRKVDISSVRLVQKTQTDDVQGAPAHDVNEDDTSYASGVIPIDRQVLDLLVEADMEGTRNIEIGTALGSYAGRTVDHILTKLERDPPPPHLSDFQVRSVIETFGREKRMRWFLLTAFLRRCARDGIPETDPKHAELESDAVGGWSELESGGFYREPGSYDKWLSEINITTPAGMTGKRPAAKKAKGPPKPKKEKVVKAKVVKAKVVKVEGEAEDVEGETEDLKGKGKAPRNDSSSEDESEVEVKKPRKKPAPRPQKPGPPTYYERRKREEAERIRLGLPPKPKRDPSLGGRRCKAAMAEAEAEKQLAIANGTWVEPPPRRNRSRKAAKSNVDGSEVDELRSESEAFDSSQRAYSVASSSAAYRPPASPSTEQPPEASTPRRKTRGMDVEPSAPLPPAVAAPPQPIASPPQPIASSPAPVARSSPQKSASRQVVVVEIPVKRGRGRPRKDGSAPKPSQPPLASETTAPKPTQAASPVVEKEAIHSDESDSAPGPSRHLTPTVADIAPSPHPEPELSPPPPPKRGCGRPRKDGTTGPRAAPVPAKASTSTSAPAAPVTRKRGSALGGDVELDASPPAKRTRRGATAAAVEQPVAEERAEPAPQDSPMEEDVPEVEAPAPRAAKTPAPAQAVDDQEDDAAIQVDASASTSRRKNPSSPSAKVPRPKQPAASSRPNLTAVKRQQDILTYLEHSGGIVDFAPRLNEFVFEFFKARDPTGPVFTMDRRICEQAVDGLINRDACRHTIMKTKEGTRNVLYLPSIALDGAEMTAFLKSATTRGAPIKAPKTVPRAGNVDDDDDKNAVAREPEWSDDSETVRAYFERDHLVAGARYGCHYGRFARARELHQFLVDFINAHPTSPYVVRNGAGAPSVVKSSILVTAIPLDIYLRIMPLSQPSERLDKFIAEPANRSRPLENLPQWAHRLIAPSVPRMRKVMTSTLRCLVELPLVKPLSEKPGKDDELIPTTAKEYFASHLEVSSTAPIYAFNEPTRPLRAVLPIRSSDDAREYWKQLHKVSLPIWDDGRPIETMDLATSNFPDVFSGSQTFAKLVTSTTKWHDEYMLLLNQRQYLANVLESRDYVLFDETPEGRLALQQLADSVLAPVAVVEEYLKQVQTRGGPKLSRAQKRKRRRLAGRDDDAPDSEEPTRARKEGDIPLAPKRDAKASLEHKAKESLAQRERDFHSIVDHFGKERGRPVYEQAVLDFLLKRFCRRQGAPFDSKALENELRILVGSDDVDPGYKSIVSASIHSKIAVANDPYALPRRVQVKKLRKLRAQPQVPHATVVVCSGTQAEFLTAPPRPVPVLGEKQRLPRNFFNAEQDDLFLDAGAILKARAKHTGGRILWAPLEPLFDGIAADKIRQHYTRLLSKKEEQLYTERLIDAWTQVWNAKRGTQELPDDQPNSMVAFDIAPFVRCLRANIDKTSLRLAGPANAPEAQAKVTPLPASITDLENDFNVVWAAGCTDLSSRWNGYWKSALGSIQRDSEAASMPFSLPAQAAAGRPLDRDFSKATSALKMVLVTPEAAYAEATGRAFLGTFEATLKPAVEELERLSMITTQQSELARRGPGRSHVLSEKYLMSFDEVVSPARLRAAERVESKLADEDPEEVWPLIVDDGDMMALVRLVSEGLVELTADPSACVELRDAEDWQTRKVDDAHLECEVTISYLDADSYVRTELAAQKPTATPPIESTDDVTQLDLALAVVLSTITDLEAEAIRGVDAALREAGSAGLTFATLKETSTLELASEAASTLTSNSPPLAFWAGDSYPVLVSSQFLSAWTVLITPSEVPTPPVGKPKKGTKNKGKGKAKEVEAVVAMEVDGETPLDERERRMIFPALWFDMNGDVVEILWDKAAGWVKGVLLAHAGATCHQIYLRAKTTEILTLGEIMLVLETLEANGVVERKAVEEEEAPLGWDDARWFLKWKWYGA